MHDNFADDGHGISTRFHIVRCALDDIRERLDDASPSPRRDELAVEALSCSEAVTRLEHTIGSTVEAREALVRRIIDLEIAVLELSRQPVQGSLSPTHPPREVPRMDETKRANGKKLPAPRNDASRSLD